MSLAHFKIECNGEQFWLLALSDSLFSAGEYGITSWFDIDSGGALQVITCAFAVVAWCSECSC